MTMTLEIQLWWSFLSSLLMWKEWEACLMKQEQIKRLLHYLGMLLPPSLVQIFIC